MPSYMTLTVSSTGISSTGNKIAIPILLLKENFSSLPTCTVNQISQLYPVCFQPPASLENGSGGTMKKPKSFAQGYGDQLTVIFRSKQN